MQNAVPGGQGAMAAVSWTLQEKSLKKCWQIEGVTVANYNCPGQIVITGWKEEVEKAADA